MRYAVVSFNYSREFCIDFGESKKSHIDLRESHSDSIDSAHNLTQCDGFDFAFNPAKCAECGGKCCIGESGYVFLKIGRAHV